MRRVDDPRPASDRLDNRTFDRGHQQTAAFVLLLPAELNIICCDGGRFQMVPANHGPANN